LPGGTLAVDALALFARAVIAGEGAANVHYHQPLYGLLTVFGPAALTLVATATPARYGRCAFVRRRTCNKRM